MKTGDAILALALGAGGGLLIWYLTRERAKAAPAQGAAHTAATPVPPPTRVPPAAAV